MKTPKTLLFVTDLRAGSRIDAISAASESARNRGYALEIVEARRADGPIGDIVRFWKPAGIIFNGSAGLGYSAAWFPKAVPVVHLDPDIDVVKLNPPYTVENGDAAIADFAFKALDRPFCRSYAFVGWSRIINWSNARCDRFEECVKSAGKPFFAVNQSWTMSNPKPLLDRIAALLAKIPTPCGVFAANDDHAAVVLTACRQAGLRVPEDVAVVGVDDAPSFCESVSPTLTSISADFAAAGRLATELLVRVIKNPRIPPEHLAYAPSGITYRASTNPPVAADRQIARALEHIRRHATDGLRAADVVAFLGLSERLSEMRFKRQTGKSITECITEVRLERVLKLLSNPRQRLDAIANLCGWSSSTHLKHLFKERFGCSMRDWRKNNGAPGATESGK